MTHVIPNSRIGLEILQGLARMLTGNYKLPVQFGETGSYTDGKTIVVESKPEYVERLKLNPATWMRCLRAHTAHEAFHVLFSDFDAWVQYLRDPDLTGYFHPEVIRCFGNAAEDARIELWGVNKFPGSKEWLTLKNLVMLVKDQPIAEERVSALLQGFIAWAKAGVLPAGYERKWPEWVKFFQQIEPLVEKARRAKSTSECLQIVKRILLDHLKPLLPNMATPEGPPPQEDDIKQGVRGTRQEGDPGELDPRIKPRTRPQAAQSGEGGVAGSSEEQGADTGSQDSSQESGSQAGSTESGKSQVKPSAEYPSVGEGTDSGSSTQPENPDKQDESTGTGNPDFGDDADSSEAAYYGGSDASDASGNDSGSSAGEEDAEDGVGPGDGDVGDDPAADGHDNSGDGQGDDHGSGGCASDGHEKDLDGDEDASQSEGSDSGSTDTPNEAHGDTDPTDENDGDGSDGSGESSDGRKSSKGGGNVTEAEEPEIDPDTIIPQLMAAAEAEEAEAFARHSEPAVREAEDNTDFTAIHQEIISTVACHGSVQLKVIEPHPAPSVFAAAKKYTGAMERDILTALKPLVVRQNSEYLTGRRRGSLDPKRLWRVSTLGDPRVFQSRRTPYDPAVAVYLLADSSGSMEDRMLFGKSEFRRVDAVRLTLVAFSEALERLGIVHAASAFSASGAYYGGTVYHRRLLKFGQKTGRESVVNFDPHASNRDGYSIRVATRELLTRQEPLRLLFVLSDGQPASWNGYTSRSPRDLGVQDTAQAVREAIAQGVEVVGFYFGARSHDKLAMEITMFTRERLVIVDDLGNLGRSMAVVLKKIVSRYRIV